MLLLLHQVVDQSRVRIKAENLRRIRNKIGKSVNVVINEAAIAVIDHVFNTTDVSLNFGIDQTALVQEFIPARNGHITRVETLGGKFLYAIDIFTTGQSFNLWSRCV
jgi:hypothetical protein